MILGPLSPSRALSLSFSSSSSRLFQITSGCAAFAPSELVPLRVSSALSFFSWNPSLSLHTVYPTAFLSSSSFCLSNSLSLSNTLALFFQIISRSSAPPPTSSFPFSRLSCYCYLPLKKTKTPEPLCDLQISATIHWINKLRGKN